MKTTTTFIIGLLVTLSFSEVLQGQSGCPGCAVQLSEAFSADTIYIGDLPDGQVGDTYNADLSFRVPKTTTPVAAADSTVIPGLAINKITITGVSNLPPGLSWEASQLEFEVERETDGCVKFCGVPTRPGYYEILVTLKARIFVIEQSSSFTIPVYIAPASSDTEGFSMENFIGCGQAKVSFVNKIPSGGNEGYSYFWDFGNGETSTEENPEEVTFTRPGEYEVNYQAVIDTAGYYLERVTILEGDCTDLFGAPDYYISVLNPQGQEIYLANHIENTYPPVSFNLNIELGAGEYTIQVTDEDGGLDGSDDRCAEIIFTIDSDSILTKDGVTLEIFINHPIDTIRSSDTVFVFPFPTPPAVTIDGSSTLCSGDSVVLRTTNYNTNLQWSKGSTALANETSSTLTVTESGAYRVGYTTPAGCTAISPVVNVVVHPLPAVPVFVNAFNLLSVNNVANLPTSHSLQWYKGGVALAGETGTTYCTKESDIYTLKVTDGMTGCTNSYSFSVPYDDDIVDCTPVGTENLTLPVENLRLYPNPTDGQFQLEFTLADDRKVQAQILDVLGRIQRTDILQSYNGSFSQRFDVSYLPKGVYLLQLQADNKVVTQRFVKQ